MSRAAAIVALAWLLVPAAGSASDQLYVSTVPSALERLRDPSSLYSLELPGGTLTLLGATTSDGRPITIAGLAIHPASGVLYAITSDSSPSHRSSLVSLDRATARATAIGRLGAPCSDITFDATGTMFTWLRETSQLGIVDVSTGKVTPVGPVRPPSEPGGISIDAEGHVYVISSGATGSIDRVDRATGEITRGPALSGAPFAAGINAISTAPGGEIYAVNTNRGSPAKSALITVDPRNGAATRIAALPDDSDAIVVIRSPWSLVAFLASRAGVTVMIALGLIAAAGAYVARSRRR